MDRRRFIQIGGSAAVGAVFAGVVGRSMWQMFKRPQDLFFNPSSSVVARHGGSHHASPFKKVLTFKLPNEAIALDCWGNSIVVATPDEVWLYGMEGEVQEHFAVGVEKVDVSSEPSSRVKKAKFTCENGLRDVTCFGDSLYMLYPTRLEVRSRNGKIVRQWEACSDQSDYCCLTVFEAGVFVTDAQNKNICQYGLDGSLVRFIQSPHGFVVPSYCFAITNHEGMVYCSNPGKHMVEVYTAEGEYVKSFGKPGRGEGQFCGCCNPARLSITDTGEVLTSEKGMPRICCYGKDGKYHGLLLDAEALGGGHAASHVRMVDGRLVVATKDKVSIYQYDASLDQGSMCASCTENCPLKM